ncbi:MAG: hypothetical protein JL50_03365 [Peptococcaceae bacterium BICA1-7]|nr:MAG: hypothetical protein JL50_03365 [Peptococcaceae bacterium BICA1-7]HBV97696.1 hypothetical protein [Desulfotomaculum sp.]
MVEQMKERPNFDQFKSYLIESVAVVAGQAAAGRDRWKDIGDEVNRADILQQLKKKLESEYGVELVWGENMVSADLPLESVAIQLHHVYSTIYLMERINNKIRNRHR